ncbi:MAG: zinc-dependent metalloprotease [Phycisphaerales bacterium]
MTRRSPLRPRLALAALLAAACPFSATLAQDAPPAAPPAPPEFPPFKDVAKDYEKVVSTTRGEEGLYTVYKRAKDNQLLAELPRGYQNQKHFFAMTVAGGDTWAGLQGPSILVYWKRFDKTMALIQPNLATRSSGDPESSVGVAQQFTDRVLLDVPIVCMGPNGQPVIDLDALLAGNAGKFFGGAAAGANLKLCTIKAAKAFPENIEITLEMPVGNGDLRSFHYSISRLPENTGYKPREADERVGYFTTVHRDLGKYRDDQKWIRYANRWNLQKRDPNLKLSPPKEPIIFYIDQTVPVRYRRWVRQGVLEWNKAFEKIGILDAVECYYQDKATNAHMDKDPEDVRYNFVRWLTNDQGTAIGPSRVDPRTGQILDADVVLTDGWIRHFWFQANNLLPEVATQGMSVETLAWLEQNPNWDPRLRLVDPVEREQVLLERAQRAALGRNPMGILRYGGRPILSGDGLNDAPPPGSPELPPGLLGVTSQFNGLCQAAYGKAMGMAMMRLNLELSELLDDPPADGGDEPKRDDPKREDPKKPEPKQPEDKLDGIPEWFVGPLLADLVAHEVGHTLGLRHNFKASSVHPLAKINSEEFKGKINNTGSVMDYNPVNINREGGPVQGDYGPLGIGAYDYWAIEYGYGFGDLKKVLARSAEPELVFLSDEDVGGSDPLARPYDFSANPLDYAQNQIRLVAYYRSKLLDKWVKDGESWSKARRGYIVTLNEQMHCLGFMAPWVGGAHVQRARKGDPNAGPPVTVVPAADQRAALNFCIETAFRDEAFGVSPELLSRMTVDKWSDEGGRRDLREESAFPIHDRILGIQASALTMLMNPGTLKRVYDNETRVPADQDMLTLPELINTISSAIWSELDKGRTGSPTNRNPLISSLRRNLQREHLTRLIDLTTPDRIDSAAGKAVSNLAIAKLREINGKIRQIVPKDGKNSGLDDYSYAHLSEAALRIEKVLDAQYIYNTDKMGGGGGVPFFLFGQPTPLPEPGKEPLPAGFGVER